MLRGTGAGVIGVGFSPDGKLLAAAARKTIRLWSLADASKEPKLLGGHPGSVAEVRFSPDGRRLAAACADGSVVLHDLAPPGGRRTLKGHRGLLWALAFDLSGRHLASASDDRTIRIWNVDSGRQTQLLEGHTDTVWGVGFASENEVVSSGADGSLRLWDLRQKTGRVLRQTKARAYWLDVDAARGRIVVPQSDGDTRLYTLVDGKVGEPALLRGHRDEVNFARVSLDGKLIATTSDDTTVRLFFSDSGKPYWRAPLMLRKPARLLTHRGWLSLDTSKQIDPPESGWASRAAERARRAVLSDDGSTLCLASYADELELYDVAADKRLARRDLSGMSQVLALPKACLGRSQDGKLWRLTETSWDALAVGTAVDAVAWIGELLVVAGGELFRLDDAGRYRSRRRVGRGVTTLSANSKLLALGFRDGNVELHGLDAKAKQPRIILELTPSSPPTAIVWGPTGTIVVGFADGTVGLWDQLNGARLSHAKLHGQLIHLLLERNKLYAATDLGQHLVWDLHALYDDYCALLRTVWKQVGVVWEGRQTRSARAAGQSPLSLADDPPS